MGLRHVTILLCLLAACASPQPRDQVVIPFEPLVAPEPLVLPSPLPLSPPVPVVVHPEGQLQPPPERDPDSSSSSRSGRPTSPPVAASRRRPECEPIPTPHLGGDALHNWCADTKPPNRFPGHDVIVNGKRFDALQVGALILWEIKTDRFDEYSPFLQRQVILNQVPELQREFEIATACSHDFVVGVSSAAHQTALRNRLPLLNIVLTEC